MRFLLAAAAAFFMLTIPASAATPHAFAWFFGYGQRALIVEQQSCTSNDPACTVYNHTGCAWTIDDFSHEAGTGILAAGAQATWSLCQVQEGYTVANGYCTIGCGQPYGIFVSATAPLDVQACFTPPGRCFTAQPVYDPARRMYNHQLCVRELYGYGEWETPIANSHGGVGIITDETATITNTGTRKARVDATVNQVGFFQTTGYCDWYATDAHVTDPFRWSP